MLDRTAGWDTVLHTSRHVPTAGTENARALQVALKCLAEPVFPAGKQYVAQVTAVLAFAGNQKAGAGVVLCPTAVINAALHDGLVRLRHVKAGDGRRVCIALAERVVGAITVEAIFHRALRG